MRECLAASGTEVVTVAVRRERLTDKQGRSLIDFLDLDRMHGPAQHRRLLHRRRRPPDRPARPRAPPRA